MAERITTEILGKTMFKIIIISSNSPGIEQSMSKQCKHHFLSQLENPWLVNHHHISDPCLSRA